jgi:hypothetical protein
MISFGGFFFVKKLTYIQKILFTIPASVFFFLFTNTAFFFQSNLYPKTSAGFVACLVAGIPFFRNALLGDLFYGVLFFGAAELVVRDKFIKAAYSS